MPFFIHFILPVKEAAHRLVLEAQVGQEIAALLIDLDDADSPMAPVRSLAAIAR